MDRRAEPERKPGSGKAADAAMPRHADPAALKTGNQDPPAARRLLPPEPETGSGKPAGPAEADVIYRELILDHFKHPRNKGELPHADAKRTEHNPLCGDTITFFLKAAKDGTIERAAFAGTGCAISQAAASLLTDDIRGKPLAAVAALSREDVRRLLAIEVSAARMTCAALGMVAARAAAAEALENLGPNAGDAGAENRNRRSDTRRLLAEHKN